MSYELRIFNGMLQQRSKYPVVNAEGAFCGFGDWSDWKDVPVIKEEAETPPDLSKMGVQLLDQAGGVAKPKLREWWGVLNWNGLDGAIYESEEIAKRASGNRRMVHVREVPSPERVREALDVWAVDAGWAGWTHCRMVNEESDLRTNKSYRRLLTLLRSLGHDTEGL